MHFATNQLTHRRLNDLLSVIVGLLAVYILAWPLLPSVNWWLHHDAPVISSPPTTRPSDITQHIPHDNQLYIPKLDMHETIHEGNSAATANLGVWRRPLSAKPSDNGNVVMVGHRFTYAGASVFYHLDKLNKNDLIVVYWQGKAYVYKVIAINVVPPSAAWVEADYPGKLLTLYTCTPLWSAKDRLVIQALPTEVK
jgi:sortase A